jgi:hypothetical protein
MCFVVDFFALEQYQKNLWCNLRLAMLKVIKIGMSRIQQYHFDIIQGR